MGSQNTLGSTSNCDARRTSGVSLKFEVLSKVLKLPLQRLFISENLCYYKLILPFSSVGSLKKFLLGRHEGGTYFLCWNCNFSAK